MKEGSIKKNPPFFYRYPKSCKQGKASMMSKSLKGLSLWGEKRCVCDDALKAHMDSSSEWNITHSVCI